MPSDPLHIVSELSEVFTAGPPEGEETLVQAISQSTRIVCVGAGRVGHSMASFAKRLGHLGWDAHWINDVTLPRFWPGDLMLIGSGSGETETMVNFGRIALREELRLGAITASRSSRLLEMSDFAVFLNCPSNDLRGEAAISSQPMTSLFEQACLIYLDSLVVELMKEREQSDSEMKERHNRLE